METIDEPPPPLRGPLGDVRLPSGGVVFSAERSFETAASRDGVDVDGIADDKGARTGYVFGLGSRSIIGGSGAAVGGATTMDILTRSRRLRWEAAARGERKKIHLPKEQQ
jgi:hypothetical protein